MGTLCVLPETPAQSGLFCRNSFTRLTHCPRLALALLVPPLDERVFVAVFKFAALTACNGRDARSKPKFSVAVAAVAVAAVAVAAVAAPAAAGVAPAVVA